ncbi:DUF2252 family protein [Burkholderia sp. SRS-W-2-2016]|uniref:DUF2252 family protein n=1 Tax=Burkholderia sp. SRS-W-2-2016 TaxID=1926878 RepID=UPI0011816790
MPRLREIAKARCAKRAKPSQTVFPGAQHRATCAFSQPPPDLPCGQASSASSRAICVHSLASPDFASKQRTVPLPSRLFTASIPTSKHANSARVPWPDERQPRLVACRAKTMARSAHAYLRGSAARFYAWLDSQPGRATRMSGGIDRRRLSSWQPRADCGRRLQRRGTDPRSESECESAIRFTLCCDYR